MGSPVFRSLEMNESRTIRFLMLFVYLDKCVLIATPVCYSLIHLYDVGRGHYCRLLKKCSEETQNRTKVDRYPWNPFLVSYFQRVRLYKRDPLAAGIIPHCSFQARWNWRSWRKRRKHETLKSARWWPNLLVPFQMKYYFTDKNIRHQWIWSCMFITFRWLGSLVCEQRSPYLAILH